MGEYNPDLSWILCVCVRVRVCGVCVCVLMTVWLFFRYPINTFVQFLGLSRTITGINLWRERWVYFMFFLFCFKTQYLFCHFLAVIKANVNLKIFLKYYCICAWSQVMDKYGEFYGQERISELLGMDKAALDFSDAHKKKKPRRDSSLSAVWGIHIRINQCFHTQFHVKFKVVTRSVLLADFLIIDLYKSQHYSSCMDSRLCGYSCSRILFAHYSK